MTKPTRQWLAAAEMLRQQGYTQTITDDPLLPVMFERGQERVYLYAPIRRRVKGPDRAWAVRKVADLPRVFGTRDIAEHFGISIEHVQFEYYRSRRLRPSQRVGANGNLLATRDDLIAWMGRRHPPGRPRTDRHRSRKTLKAMTIPALWAMYRQLVEKGEIAPVADEVVDDWLKDDLIDYLTIEKENA